MKGKRGFLSGENGAELTQDRGRVAGILNKSFASVSRIENTKTFPRVSCLSKGIKPLEMGTKSGYNIQKYLDHLDTDNSAGLKLPSRLVR